MITVASTVCKIAKSLFRKYVYSCEPTHFVSPSKDAYLALPSCIVWLVLYMPFVGPADGGFNGN
jgi:hypothetical protein